MRVARFEPHTLFSGNDWYGLLKNCGTIDYALLRTDRFVPNANVIPSIIHT
jgi:hypothetical protein